MANTNNGFLAALKLIISNAEGSLVSAFSARDAVLHRCHQHEPISFSEAFPAR
jgi:hypothetical protein